jgi:hypothetical protein
MSGKTTKEGQTSTAGPPSVEQAAKIELILQRARQGDIGVLPELQKILDDHPKIWAAYGNVAERARMAWIDMFAGKNQLVAASITRDCEAWLDELTSETPSSQERLLAERIVSCRLQVSHAEASLAKAGAEASAAVVAVSEKRITACQKRLLTAMRELALYQKALGIVPAPACVRPEPVKRTSTPDTSPVSASEVKADPVIAAHHLAALAMPEDDEFSMTPAKWATMTADEKMMLEFNQIEAREKAEQALLPSNPSGHFETSGGEDNGDTTRQSIFHNRFRGYTIPSGG